MIIFNILFAIVFFKILIDTDYTDKKGHYIMDGMIFAFNVAIILDYFI